MEGASVYHTRSKLKNEHRNSSLESVCGALQNRHSSADPVALNFIQYRFANRREFVDVCVCVCVEGGEGHFDLCLVYKMINHSCVE